MSLTPTHGPGELPSPETRARRRDLALRTLTGVSRLLATLDFDETLDAIVKAFLELTHSERGFLFLAGPDGHLAMRVGRTSDGGELPADQTPRVSTTLVQRVLAEKRCVYVRNVAADPTLADQPSVVTLGLGSALCLPMVLSGGRGPGGVREGEAAQMLGVIYLDTAAQGGAMSSEDFVQFQALGNLAAAALVNAQVHRDAITDSLTGLAHRRQFDRALNASLDLCGRAGRPVALLMIDLDNFKRVNDEGGHGAGDDVLRAAARLIQAAAKPGDVAARYGGDEFAIIFPGKSAAEGAKAGAALCERVREHFRDIGPVPLTLSVGVAATDGKEKLTREELLRRADAALYESKGGGRDRVTAWSAALARPAARADELAGVFTGEAARDYRTMRMLLQLLLDGAAAEGETPDRLGRVLARVREAVSAGSAALYRAAEGSAPEKWLGAGSPELDAAAAAAAQGKPVAAGFWAVPLRREGALVGVLALAGPRSGSWPGGHDRALLEALGPQLALLMAEGLLRDASRRAEAAEREQLAEENERLATTMRRRGVLVGESPQMRESFEIVRRAAPSTATVLIVGETGTGKESLARLFHDMSRRAKGPYVVADCTTIPKDLVEGELFGHEKGAYTGASETKKGLLETAHGGTLFLDEVTELPPAAQSRLLRFLQEGEARRVGATDLRKLDVRVVAATNRDPEEESKAGRLRPDLYFRLRVVTLRVPPLRERGEDIQLLAEHLLARYARVEGKHFAGFDESAVAAMRAHDWPGNVRDLEHRVQRAVLFAAGTLISAADMELVGGKRAAAPAGEASGSGLRQRVDSVERGEIERALKEAKGNVTHAAERLHLSRTTLQALMRRHGITREAFGG